MKKSFEEMKNDLSWKASELKFRVKQDIKDTANWVANNKEVVVLAIPVVAAVAKGTAKAVHGLSNNIAIKQDQKWKDTHMYDHSSGRYIQLRRKLTGAEMAKVLDVMDQTGKKKVQVLRDLGFTKD